MSRRLARAGGLALFFQLAAWAAPAASPSWFVTGKTGSLSAPMQIVLLLTALTLLPAAVVSVTPFLRITIVLHFLRQALGTQTAPSNQVLVGMALFLSLLTIQPMASQIYEQAWTPMENGRMTVPQAAQGPEKAVTPVLAALRPGEGHRLVPGGIAFTGAPHAGRCGSESPDSGLHPVGVEGFLSNWRGALPALPGHRPGGGLGNPVGGHGAVAARHDLGALQDSAVRAGGWLEPGDRIAHEKLCLRTAYDHRRRRRASAPRAPGGILDCGAADGHRLRRRRGDQPGADCDLHSGYRLQHYSPPDRVCAGHPAADALDDPTHNGLHHGFVGRSGAVCPLISPWASPRSTGFCWCWHGFPESSRWCPCPAFKAVRGWRALSCRYRLPWRCFPFGRGSTRHGRMPRACCCGCCRKSPWGSL